MFSYFAYGLGIQSTLPLPEFVAAEAGCDVIIRLEPNGDDPAAIHRKRWPVKMTAAEAVLPVQDIGVFLVRGGREIIVRPCPGVDERLLQLYLAGTVMAALLYQRDLLVLHASAVALNDCAIAFLGASGWGKSSMAAALHARGCALIADDVTAVRLGTRSASVFPAFPQLKLSPEVAAVLGFDGQTLLVLHPLEKKRGCRAIPGFSSAPLPLKCAYVLAEDDAQGIEPIAPRDAVIELVRHSYPTRLLQPGGARHLRQCVGFACEVPVYRLKRPRSLALLSDTARLVEEHAAGDVQQRAI
jgi:hypothetical protein